MLFIARRNEFYKEKKLTTSKDSNMSTTEKQKTVYNSRKKHQIIP